MAKHRSPRLRHPTTHRLAQAADLDPPSKPKHHPPDPRERRQVAGFRSEPWPASDRNGWPASDWNAWPASSESAIILTFGNIAKRQIYQSAFRLVVTSGAGAGGFFNYR